MDDYRPNPDRFKKEPEETKKKEIQAVATAKQKKKTAMNKLGNIFIAEDIETVKNYILMDVIVPTIKRAIIDTISLVLNGEIKKPSSPRTAYRSMYDDRDREIRRDRNRRYVSETMTFDTRGEAEEVLETMRDILMQYEKVSVMDLYDLSDYPKGESVDNNYGWTNLRDAEVVRVRDGYIIRLPRPKPINNI